MVTHLTDDAIIFAMAYLSGPNAQLSFGGDGAEMEITPRARAALDCLLENGAAEKATPTDQWHGREHYRGVVQIWPIAKERGLNPFDCDLCGWATFVKKGSDA
ncbi:hypothetical protein U713_07385 [Rhodobacter capsulatus YW2]|nr:hypothetical protein U713_07385 [Rhodobacter capsulatus YW2]